MAFSPNPLQQPTAYVVAKTAEPSPVRYQYLNTPRLRRDSLNVGVSGLYGARTVWLVFLIYSTAVADRVPFSR